MSIAVKSGLPSLGSTEGAVISADEVSVSEDGSAAASVGEDLPRGKSAYEIAKENGFDGTEAEWLASLKGAPGAAGANGKDGENGKTPYVGDNGNWYIGADDTGKPSRGAKGEPGSPGAKGDKGDTGATPNLTIGSVTTLDAGQNATASMGGTAESPVLNLGIPKGAKGEPGQGGGGAWYVTVTPGTNNSATADKTAAEVYAAYEAGKAVYCILLDAISGAPVVLPLLAAVNVDGYYLFCFAGSGAPRVSGSAPFSLTVTYDGTWHYFHDELVSGELVTSVSSSSTNKQVPSAKCLYDIVGNIADRINAL